MITAPSAGLRLADVSTGLIAYQVGIERIHALMIGQDGALQRFPLMTCSDAIPRIDRLLAALQTPTSTTPATQARLLEEFSGGWGRDLLPPSEAIAGKDVLVIVPHDLLHGLPLHLVRPAGEQFLATSHGISYCSSATLYRRCVARNAARRNGAPKDRSCAVLGVDVLTGKDAEYRGLAEAFGSHFSPAEPLESRTELKDFLDWRLSRAADVLCVVCHGYIDDTLPTRSGLLLVDRRGVTGTRTVRVHRDDYLRFMDWPFTAAPLAGAAPPLESSSMFGVSALTVGELMVHCRTSAELVTLFGCYTGTGHLEAGDDYQSLAYQWLKIGAASVLANLWEADLRDLRELADRFAENWAHGGLPKALALRAATCEMLDDLPEVATRPAQWGSLALLGDWL